MIRPILPDEKTDQIEADFRKANSGYQYQAPALEKQIIPEDITKEKLNAFIAYSAFPQINKIDIPEPVAPRKFIYGKHFIKSFVTGTAATGGTGKTALVDTEIVSLALGRDLLKEGEPLKAGAQNVLLLSLEDDEDEYKRRHKAIAKFYRLSDEDIKQRHKNIFPIFDNAGDLKIVYEYDKKLIKNDEAIKYINQQIDIHDIDVVTIDPLISIHEADENTNKEMQLVLSVLRTIAREKDVAVHYLHHNRKGGGDSADDMRGAVALRDGSRVLRMISKMSEAEAKELSIKAEEAIYLIGVFNCKNNFEPLGISKTWYRTNSACLDNATDIYSADYVAVVSDYKLPGLFDGISMANCEKAWQTIKTLPQEKMRSDKRAANWMGKFIADDIELDAVEDKARLGNILSSWKRSGIINETTFQDNKKRDVPHYEFIKIPDIDDGDYDTF